MNGASNTYTPRHLQKAAVLLANEVLAPDEQKKIEKKITTNLLVINDYDKEFKPSRVSPHT